MHDKRKTKARSQYVSATDTEYGLRDRVRYELASRHNGGSTDELGRQIDDATRTNRFLTRCFSPLYGPTRRSNGTKAKLFTSRRSCSYGQPRANPCEWGNRVEFSRFCQYRSIWLDHRNESPTSTAICKFTTALEEWTDNRVSTSVAGIASAATCIKQDSASRAGNRM